MPLIKSSELTKETQLCPQETFFACVETGSIELLNEVNYSAEHLTAKNKEGKTALYLAAEAGQKEMVERLTEDMRTENISTYNLLSANNPLDIAILKNHTAIIECLSKPLVAGGLFNHLQTYIKSATEQGKYEIVKILFQQLKRIQDNTQEAQNKAFEYAVRFFNEKAPDDSLIQFYAEEKMDFTPHLKKVLGQMSSSDKRNLLQALLTHQPSLLNGEHGKIAFNETIQRLPIQFIYQLLKSGADVLIDKSILAEARIWGKEQAYIDWFSHKNTTKKGLTEAEANHLLYLTTEIRSTALTLTNQNKDLWQERSTLRKENTYRATLDQKPTDEVTKLKEEVAELKRQLQQARDTASREAARQMANRASIPPAAPSFSSTDYSRPKPS